MFSSPTQALLGTRDTLQIESHREQLNRRILELKSEIQALQDCYNSLAIPNRIPPEILSKIFLAVALLSKNNDDDEEDLEWIRVTHVCRYWRQTALDCLELWTNLSFVNPEFTEVMIARSRNAPLSIECGWKEESNIHDVLCRVLSRTERLRSVTLASSFLDSEPLDLPSLLSIMSGPAPALEDIRLFVMRDVDEPVILPTQFLEGTAPNLKVLDLHAISASNWSDLPIRATLTRLRLERDTDFHFNPTPNPASPSWTQLLAAIQDMTNLDELVLAGFLPTGTLPPKYSPMMAILPVALHKLRCLKLLGPGVAVEAFLAVVRFPNAADVDIGFGDVQDLPFIHRVLPKLEDSWDGRCKTPARNMRMFDTKVMDGPRVVVGFNSKKSMTSTPKLHLNFTRSERPTLSDIMVALHERMDFSQLSNLQVISEAELTKEAWTRVFGTLRELKTIAFESNSFSNAFAEALGTLGVPPSLDPVFPALSSLDFMFQDFDSLSTSQLISALKSRPALSRKLRVNFFAECSFRKDSFQRIVDSLPNVRVKRHRLDNEDSDFVSTDGSLSDSDIIFSEEEGSVDGDRTDSSNEGSTGSSSGDDEEDEDGQGGEGSSESSGDLGENEGAGMETTGGSNEEEEED